MVCERHVALVAVWHPSALAALYHRREAAAVLKQYGLFAVVQGLAHGCHQAGRERTAHHLAALQVFNVHHLNLGQAYVVITLHKAHQAKLARMGVVPALERRRGRAEQHLCAKLARKHYGHAAGMIARGGVLLLERRLVFLVDDDKAEIGERQEHGRARTEYNVVGRGRQLLLPYLHALGVGIL